MAVATFDTLKFANTLKAAGVPPQQAEAQAAAFAEVMQVNFKELVTKDDLGRAVAELRREVHDVRDELKREIADVKEELRRHITDVRDELNREVADVKDELKRETAGVRDELNREVAEVRREVKEVRDTLRQEIKDEALKLHAKIDTLYAKLVGEMTLLKWMFGLNVTVLAGLLVRSLLFRTP